MQTGSKSLKVCAVGSSGLLVLTLGGCAPSDPEGPPVGFRVDRGELVVYVPMCPGERLIAAQVDLIDDQGDAMTVWTGKAPRHPVGKRAAISAAGWGEVTGRFVYTGQPFSVSVEATAGSYGTSVLPSRVLTQPLTADTYDADGDVLTSQQIDQRADCP